MSDLSQAIETTLAETGVQHAWISSVSGPPPDLDENLLINVSLEDVFTGHTDIVRLWRLRSQACLLLAKLQTLLHTQIGFRLLAITLIDSADVRPFRIYSVTLPRDKIAHPWINLSHDPFSITAVACSEFSMDPGLAHLIARQVQCSKKELSFAEWLGNIELAGGEESIISDFFNGVGALRLALAKKQPPTQLVSQPEFAKLGVLFCRLAFVSEDLGDKKVAFSLHSLANDIDSSAGNLNDVKKHLDNMMRLLAVLGHGEEFMHARTAMTEVSRAEASAAKRRRPGNA